VNHDCDNDGATLFLLDGFFFSLFVGKAGGFVEEEEVSGIGSTMGNQIVGHFLAQVATTQHVPGE